MGEAEPKQLSRSLPEILYFLQYQPSIDCTKPDRIYPDNQWLADCDKHGLCSLCRHVDRSAYPRPLDIVLAEPPILDEEVAFSVATTAVTVWHRCFIEMISKDLSGYVLGRCLLSDGTEFNDFVTVYSRDYVVVRRGAKSRYKTCTRCGTVVSEAVVGPKYVLDSGLRDDRVYQDARCQFYMTEEALSEYLRQRDMLLLPKGIGVSRS